MTCRHGPNDPACSSNPNGYAAYEAARERDEASRREREKLEAEIYARTPDVENYEVVEVERVGRHLVMKVRYPNCSKCAYEGNKVMVFLHVSEASVLRWRRIDPHFRNPTGPRTPREAPPPAARYPASPEGWSDALAYARSKGQRKSQDDEHE